MRPEFTLISKRSIMIGLMLLLPVFVYVGFGGYALWQTGLFRWTWWIIPGCWVLTYFVSLLWPPPKRVDLGTHQLPLHWTPKDEAAMQIVVQFQQEVDKLSPEQLTDIRFYFDQAQELAEALAKHYHPKAKQLYSSLTVLEVLAAIRLAVDDIEIWFRDSVPGSHLVTIDQWKLLGKAPKWVKQISDAGWLASIAFNPLNAAKYFSSKLTLDPIAEELRTEFLAVVYLRFIRQVGFYLVEMNSGRLRRGADRYRAAFGSGSDLKWNRDGDPGLSIQPESVVVAVVGQVKAGKSSVVNALIGKRETVTDVLPQTRLVTRHTFCIPGSSETMTLLDTPGYADSGATKTELRELEKAVDEADVILLVVDAHSPARAADLQLIRDLQQRALERPELKPAPVVVCMTHIDLLSPMMEWQPPYDWETPDRVKEHSIRGALESIQEVLGHSVRDVVAVCSDVDRNRVLNVQEGLIPSLASVLGQGKTVGLLKAYEKNLDADRFSALLGQLKESGKTLFHTWVEERLNRGPSEQD